MLFSDFFRFVRYLNLKTVREILQRTSQQRLTGLAAEIAYNAMLALFPALLTIVAAIGLFTSLQATLYNQARLLGNVAPDEVRILIRGLIHDITAKPSQGLFSLGFIIALWAFSGAISAAMTALDSIHQVPSTQSRSFWKIRLVSLFLTIGTIGLLLIASFLVFVSDFVVQLIANQSCLLEAGDRCQIKSELLRLWRLGRLPIALGIVASAFALLYRFGPSRRPPRTPILPGAVLAAISWALLSSLFRFYVSSFGHFNRTYGAIGTVIILQLWLYLSALVMLVGAQVNVVVGEAMRYYRRKPPPE